MVLDNQPLHKLNDVIFGPFTENLILKQDDYLKEIQKEF